MGTFNSPRSRYASASALCAAFILLPYLATYYSPDALRLLSQSAFSPYLNRTSGNNSHLNRTSDDSPHLNRISGNSSHLNRTSDDSPLVNGTSGNNPLLNRTSDKSPLLNRTSSNSSSQTQEELGNLQGVLKSASFRNKTVIITTLNQAWAANNSMIDLFLESFRLGEGTRDFLDHLVIVVLDQVAHDRCISVHKHCFTLRTEGVDFSGEKFFMTDDYLKMMWKRLDLLRIVLELGYNFVFTDADIMWFRDPFPHFSTDADFEIACDKFNGNPTSLANLPNNGFVHVRSNERTINFYKFWNKCREIYPGENEQEILNKVKLKSNFRKIGMKMRFLSTKFFGGFCQASRDFDKVCIMHANCCVGLVNKIRDLTLIIEDWKHYKSMTDLEKQLQKVRWRAPRACRHSFRG
ncbi:hypothetical protein O6H91_04G137900 [Diphasiastrum complanatum]|uniref:Uncharacterized protein n=1 Tax=Diphasiastrum complanatum TaxID=34168 RepID=A0ACC2E2N3_DIPCM|nr:hypothetical protein O6H91_04G137900 [Diphasiastrum complanatum]